MSGAGHDLPRLGDSRPQGAERPRSSRTATCSNGPEPAWPWASLVCPLTSSMNWAAAPGNWAGLSRRTPGSWPGALSQVQAPKLPDQLRKPTCRARSEAAAATLPRTASYARSTLYSRQDADGAAPDKPWERCQCGL